MSTNHTPHDPAADESFCGDQNVQRLLGQAYKPEIPDPAFVRHIEDCLLATARELAQSRTGADPLEQAQLRHFRRRMSCVMGAAAAAACVALFLHAMQHRPGASLASRHPVPATFRFDGPEGLTARSRPPAPAPQPLTVGELLHTQAGQRRRVALPDGSVLYVNENSAVKLDAERRLTLSSGEVFVEVAPREQAAFVVHTPQREVSALGTKFAVRAGEAGTSVVVTQGKVRVSGVEGLLQAGQQLPPGTAASAPAPRASHLLDWTRDLMTLAEAPLVPDSRFAGGALLTVDPNGQEAKLSLRKYHVDVYIEDGFARTTIDQTYFNHEYGRLEGTFYFPLPPDASLSRLAMYVDGKLMEGGMAERDHARNVFEQIMYTRRDPALLEWVDGSMFKMRVFPLEGRQVKRIVLGYTQRLSSLYGRTQYRFPSGHNLDVVHDWSFHAFVKGGDRFAWNSESHKLKETRVGGDLVLDGEAKDVKIDRDATLSFFENAGPVQGFDSVRFSSAEHEGTRYLLVRYRPELPTNQVRQRRDWVFLYESSGDRDPLLARVQVDVIRGLLANAEHNDSFTVLSAGTRVQTFSDELRPVSQENIRDAVEFLERAHLVGALDLGQALTVAKRFLKVGKNPYLVHVGSGVAGMGEHGEDVLARMIPDGVCYVGVGVGKRWGRGFMKAAAERGGGYFTQINPDEPVGWRAFDLAATLNTPRLLNVKVVDNAERTAFLSHAGSLAQGEELCTVARLPAGAKTWPESITITGTLEGKPFHRVLVVKDVAGHADYLPRTWAKLEIDRLLAENAQANKDTIIALSKAMYVMTPFTSLLVLENEDMYRQFNVDRGRNDHWAMYRCPERIPVVYEPDQGTAGGNASKPEARGKKRSVAEVLKTIVVRVPPRVFQASIPEHHGGLSVIRPPRAVVNEEIDTDPTEALTYNIARLEDTLTSAASMSNAVVGLWEERTGSPVGPLNNGALVAEHLYEGLRGHGLARAMYGIRNTHLENFPFNSVAFSSDGKNLVTAGADLSVRIWDSATGKELLGRGWVYREVANSSMHLPAHFFQRSPSGGLNPAVEGVGRPVPQPYLNLLRHDNVAFNYYSNLQLFSQDLAVPNSINIKSATRTQAEALASINGRININSATLFDFDSPSLRTPPPALRQKLERAGIDVLSPFNPEDLEDDDNFYDLVAYAPGMNTRQADILAVLEAEAAIGLHPEPVAIDPNARKLLARAREVGWQELTTPAGPSQAAIGVFFDGIGRFAYERVLPEGLRERVVCDGKTLLYLYPELGIGARRIVSRFHRDEFNQLVPWVPLAAEDLAWGADLKCIGERTVAILPRGADSAKGKDGKPVPYTCIHLLFAGTGQLTERRLVEMPAGKTLLRETYADGEVKLFDADGKGLTKHKWIVRAAKAPDLNPDTKDLVVLPLPWRTWNHVEKAFKIDAAKAYETPTEEAALAGLAAGLAEGNENVMKGFGQRFQARGDRRVGFWVLYASTGIVNIQPRAGEPLARYLAFATNAGRRHQAELGDFGSRPDSFISRLAAFHDLQFRWVKQDKIRQGSEAQRKKEWDRAFDFVRQNRSSVLGLAALALIKDRENSPAFQQTVADLFALFEDAPGLAYTARYERARALLKAGKRPEAQDLFLAQYTKTFKEGVLPPIDENFRSAFQPGIGAEKWTQLMHETAASLVARKQRFAVIVLAWQCREAGDAVLGDELFTTALADVQEKERRPLSLVGLNYLLGAHLYDRATVLLRELLDDPKSAEHSALWRLGVQLALRRDVDADVVWYLEKALDLEYQHLPETINLQLVRQDYGLLLARYLKLAEAMNTLRVDPPDDFLPRVVRAADRWRALDNDPTAACQAAAQVLSKLGAKEMAWEYVTTPVALHANESGPWVNVAAALRNDGDRLLADRAYALAFEAEATNGRILYDRAMNLKLAGKSAEARQLFRRLADGPWQPRFSQLQEEARGWAQALR
jgi:ferric-dicitrate binding protein FerR (iron transport regulator)